MKAIFAHKQTYSRKGNGKSRCIADLCAEAARLEGAAPHVDMPKPPRLLEGVNPDEIPGLIEERIKAQNRVLRARRKEEPQNAEKMRGIRADTHVMVASVFSYPDAVSDYDEEEYRTWIEDVIAFAKSDAERNELEIQSIVEHTDEAHPHIHVLAVPRLTEANPRMNAKLCHEGHVAQDRHKATQASGPPSRAFKSAMRKWQDRYHEIVGQKHGQARFGPKRRRLSRAQWQAEQQRLSALKDAAMAERGLQKFSEQADAMADHLAQRERRLTKEEARLEAEERKLSDERLKLVNEAAEIRRNTARDAVRVAVEMVAGVFVGDVGIGRDGKVFVRSDDLHDRANALRFGSIFEDSIEAVATFWADVKSRLSPSSLKEKQAEVGAAAQKVLDRTSKNTDPAP